MSPPPAAPALWLKQVYYIRVGRLFRCPWAANGIFAEAKHADCAADTNSSLTDGGQSLEGCYVFAMYARRSLGEHDESVGAQGWKQGIPGWEDPDIKRKKGPAMDALREMSIDLRYNYDDSLKTRASTRFTAVIVSWLPQNLGSMDRLSSSALPSQATR